MCLDKRFPAGTLGNVVCAWGRLQCCMRHSSARLNTLAHAYSDDHPSLCCMHMLRQPEHHCCVSRTGVAHCPGNCTHGQTWLHKFCQEITHTGEWYNALKLFVCLMHIEREDKSTTPGVPCLHAPMLGVRQTFYTPSTVRKQMAFCPKGHGVCKHHSPVANICFLILLQDCAYAVQHCSEMKERCAGHLFSLKQRGSVLLEQQRCSSMANAAHTAHLDGLQASSTAHFAKLTVQNTAHVAGLQTRSAAHMAGAVAHSATVLKAACKQWGALCEAAST